jgi:hypothetical protein
MRQRAIASKSRFSWQFLIVRYPSAKFTIDFRIFDRRILAVILAQPDQRECKTGMYDGASLDATWHQDGDGLRLCREKSDLGPR